MKRCHITTNSGRVIQVVNRAIIFVKEIFAQILMPNFFAVEKKRPHNKHD